MSALVSLIKACLVRRLSVHITLTEKKKKNGAKALQVCLHLTQSWGSEFSFQMLALEQQFRQARQLRWFESKASKAVKRGTALKHLDKSTEWSTKFSIEFCIY